MGRRLLSVVPIVLAVLVVGGVALALSACGGGGGAGQEQANKPRPLPEDEKPLHPGEYRTEEFKPSFSFRVGKDWSMETDPPEAPNELEITWRKGTMNLFVMNIQEVYEPTKTGASSLVQAPKDMVGWFQHHPYLKTSKLKPVTIGGVKGEQFDVVVDVPKDFSGTCGTGGCLDIAALGEFTLSTGIPLAFAEGVKERVIVLDDVKGETVTIDFGAGNPGTKFDEYAPEGQKLVDSIKWTGS
jgi:putative transposon-encoded protein